MTMVRRILALAVFVGLLVAGWRFAAVNEASVSIDYLFGRFDDVPLWRVLVASTVLGGVAVGLLAALELGRAGFVARRYRKAIAALESEVHHLRNLPLAVENLSAEGTVEASDADPALAAVGGESGQGA